MKKTFSLVLMIILIITSLAVYAAGTVTMKLVADKSTLVAGEEITLTFSIASITGIEGGIKAIQGTVDYDKNVFEEITTSSKVDMNGWSTDLNTANNKFAGTSNGASSGNVFTLTLKVKEGVTAKSTVVTIKDIKTADPTTENDDKIEVANVSTTIGSTIITPTNNTVNTVNTVGNTNNSVVKNLSNVDNTITNSTTLPKTGVSPYIMLAITTVIIVAVVSIIRYKNIIK